MPIDITLNKLKYRMPGKTLRRLGVDLLPEGTRVFIAGKFASKARNAPKKEQKSTLRPRRRAYGPW